MLYIGVVLWSLSLYAAAGAKSAAGKCSGVRGSSSSVRPSFGRSVAWSAGRAAEQQQQAGGRNRETELESGGAVSRWDGRSVGTTVASGSHRRATTAVTGLKSARAAASVGFKLQRKIRRDFKPATLVERAGWPAGGVRVCS